MKLVLFSFSVDGLVLFTSKLILFLIKKNGRFGQPQARGILKKKSRKLFIKEIELNNFRIYKDLNKIELLSKHNKNIIVVSGKNGFGKTTFLMSLVC